MGEEYLSSEAFCHNRQLIKVLQYRWIEKDHHFSFRSFGYIRIMLTFI